MNLNLCISLIYAALCFHLLINIITANLISNYQNLSNTNLLSNVQNVSNVNFTSNYQNVSNAKLISNDQNSSNENLISNQNLSNGIGSNNNTGYNCSGKLLISSSYNPSI
jgi:hypothetical protein